MIWVVIAMGIALADLIFKRYVDRYKSMHSEETLPGGRVILTKYHNKGAVCGILSDKPDVMKGISLSGLLLSLVGLLKAVAGKGPKMEKLGQALIAGGAASNTADRLIEGRVTDYIRLNLFGRKSRLVYNLGDFAIFGGTILVLFSSMRKKNG